MNERTHNMLQILFYFKKIVLVGKIKLDRKGTINRLPQESTATLGDRIEKSPTSKACPSHKYNFQTISIAPSTVYRNKQDFIPDKVELEGSPLNLHFNSFDRNSFDTGVAVQVHFRNIYCLKLALF